MPSIYHLLVLLKNVGYEGSGARSAEGSVFFGVRYGTISNCTNRIVKVIVRLNLIKWPDEVERSENQDMINKFLDFQGCAGISNGTLFVL